MLFKEIINLWFWGFWASFLGSQCSDVCAEWGSQSLLLLRHVYLWGPQLKNSEDYFKKDHWYQGAKNLWHINSFLRRLNDLCSLAPTYLPFPSETACKLQAEMLCAPPFASTTWYCTQRQASLSTIKLIMACVSESWYPTVYCLYCILYAKTIVWLKCRSPVRICMSNHGGEYWQISESDLTNETKPSRGYSNIILQTTHDIKPSAEISGIIPWLCSLLPCHVDKRSQMSNNAEMVFKWLAVMLHYPCAQKIATIHPSCFHSADDSEGESSGCLN